MKDGEQTYDWYRKTHADWAAKRYGVDPAKVGDGMDTWHWWCGVDNPGYWREMAKLTSKKQNVHAGPDRSSADAARRTAGRAVGKDRAHQRPRLRARRQARPIRPEDRPHEGRHAHVGSGGLRFLQRRRRPATLHQQELRRQEMVDQQVPRRRQQRGAAVSWSAWPAPCATRPSTPTGRRRNPAEPKWENIDSHIGSQYFREGMLFGFDMPKDSFAWHYLHSQPPGHERDHSVPVATSSMARS